MAMKNLKQPTETIEQFSNHLKTLRTQKGLSQGELAVRAGITRQAVSSIESNLYLPTTGVALHLASALTCRVEDLFNLRTAEDIVEGKLIGHLPQHDMMASPIRVKVSTVGSKTVVRPVTGLGEALSFTVPADIQSHSLSAPVPGRITVKESPLNWRKLASLATMWLKLERIECIKSRVRFSGS